MAKKEVLAGLLLTNAQRAIIEKSVFCRLCGGSVSTYNILSETLVQCDNCRELYVCSIFEKDIFWLPFTDVEKTRKHGRHIFWRHDDETWRPKRPARNRAATSTDSGNSRGIDTESLAKARTAHSQAKALLEELAWSRSKDEIVSALLAQGCPVNEVILLMSDGGNRMNHHFYNSKVAPATIDALADTIIAFLKLTTDKLVGITLVHDCGFEKVATLPG